MLIVCLLVEIVVSDDSIVKIFFIETWLFNKSNYSSFIIILQQELLIVLIKSRNIV